MINKNILDSELSDWSIGIAFTTIWSYFLTAHTSWVPYSSCSAIDYHFKNHAAPVGS